MSHQTRTPRARVGKGLKPMVVRVEPEVEKLIWKEAADSNCSVAEIIRAALDWYFNRPSSSC